MEHYENSSRIDRLSICMQENLSYSNYICIKDVPHSYDDLYLYGFGMIISEFYRDGELFYTVDGDIEDLTLVPCLEIMLSKEPRVNI